MTPRKASTLSRGNSAAKPAAVTGAREVPIAQGVSSALMLLYWQIGRRIRTDILEEERAEYGERIVHAVRAECFGEFGRWFTTLTERLTRQRLHALPAGSIEGSA